MLYKTHLLFSILISIFITSFIYIKSKYLFILILLLSTFIPDIDHPDSKIGKKFRFSSYVLNKLFSHRGFFHSLIFPILIYFIFSYIFELKEIALAVSLGISSHLFLDLLTKEGLSLFAPFSNKRIHGFIKTGSILEKILFIILLFSFFILTYKHLLNP